MFVYGMIVGGFLGSIFGVFLMSAIIAGGKADDQQESFNAGYNKGYDDGYKDGERDSDIRRWRL